MKKIIVSLTVIIVVFISIIFIYQDSNNKVLINQNTNNKINSNTLTMMYETASNSGEYQVASDTAWPQDGYIFNETLSKRENGSSLTWNEETKSVIMEASISDKCYVYFDKEDPYLTFNFLGNGSGRLYLNNVNITDQISGTVTYKIGDELSYTHLQACPERGLKIYDESHTLIKQISSGWGYSYEDIILTGEERFIEEYTEGKCEPYANAEIPGTEVPVVTTQ